jgi:thymidylate synthase ThyX
MMSRTEEIEALRKAMGTHPETSPPREDEIYYGLKNLKVELIDYPANPYRAIYEIVTSTWGGRHRWWHRWENASVEGRIQVVLAALQRKTLQQCLEAPSFTFKIQGLTRSAYDQLARHRHAGIGSVGSRDNNHLDAALVLPRRMEKYDDEIRLWWRKTKDLYAYLLGEGRENWQNARSILPMAMEWRFTWCLNYRGLQDVCAQRLSFCEQWDTVGAVWKMRREVEEKFPLLACFLRPGCDWARRCTYSETYSLSELFGCLFAPCGRWPKPREYVYATFNEACTDVAELEEDLGFHIPRPDEWDKLVEDALRRDRRFFEDVP